MRVVFDTDGVLADGLPAPWCEPRPGIRELFAVLAGLGVEIHVWSGGGALHAHDVAMHIGVGRFVESFHDKADFPMTAESAAAVLGFVPDLTVDDDPHEALEGVPFFNIPLVPHWGSWTRKPPKGVNNPNGMFPRSTPARPTRRATKARVRSRA